MVFGSVHGLAHVGLLPTPSVRWVAVDIAVDERWVDFCESAMRHGLRSCWSTPILDADRGEVLGTFAVYHASPWRPTRTAMDLVNRFTYTAAIAIGTHALFSQLQESESRFRSAFTGAAVGMAVTDVGWNLASDQPCVDADAWLLGDRAEDLVISSKLQMLKSSR